jgi:hypothetical protein
VTSGPALRLHDIPTDRHVIVERGRVYADLNGDGRISRHEEAVEELLGSRHAAVIDAAAFIGRLYDPRVPGVATADQTVVNGGALNAVELDEFGSTEGTPVERTRLAEHLAFFDGRQRGRISLLDGYRGWRALGTGRLRSIVQTAGSALVFGRSHFGTVVLADIGRVRPSGATGIYDRDGNIDESRWRRLHDACWQAAPDGVIDPDRLRAIVEALGPIGRVPARQFDSLFRVCEWMNGVRAVTIDQLRWLYDGTLLYRAASMADQRGRRRLRSAGA